MKVNDFLATKAVFTVDEVDNLRLSQGTGKLNTRKALLAYYLRHGRIIRVRRGLFATIPAGQEQSYMVNPFLVAAKLAEDAVVAYHSALEFYGKAYSVHNRISYLSAHRASPLDFQSRQYVCVKTPKKLEKSGCELFAVTKHLREGVEMRVTSLERTFVDVLDRPDLVGSWEEIWRSLEAIEYLDLETVIEYVRLLENRTTAAKVGFFVETHQGELMASDEWLGELQKLRPQKPLHMNRSRDKGCKLVTRWNLLVPPEILNKTWEDVL